ncbi:MAG: branched-chain amino acid transporter permease [Hyphomicrobiales bacterium]|nr:branched-chain amino acid transporter permease [Hyphomicrobiales bacterium]
MSEPGASPVPPLRDALRDAGFAALISAGLAFPILALGTQMDLDNRLVLEQRWSWLVIAVLLVFFGRLCALLLADLRSRLLAVPGTWPLVGGAALVATQGGSRLTDGVGWMAIGAVMIGGGIALDRRLAARGAIARDVPAPTAQSALLARVLPLAGIAVLFAFPLLMFAFLGASGSLKWINNYGIQILIFVMLGWGLNIVVGLAGLLDLGYVAFYAVGAYAYALLSTQYGLSFWLCLPLAGVFAAAWGLILGFPVLRLRGDYLAIVTLAFGEIIGAVLTNWSDLTNGKAGIMSIPRITFFGLPFTDSETGFAAAFGLEFSPIHRTIFLFYLILCLALLTNFVTLRLRRMPVGRAWEALREDEIACRSLGINTTNTKLTAFALGAMFGGFAGSFFAVRQGFVNPDSFTFVESATILAIVVLGGMGSQFGVALAAVVMVGGTEVLRELSFLKQIFGNSFDPALYRMLIFGFAMVVMMIWRPRGLISARSPSVIFRKRKSVSGALVNEGHG